jgi:hypothetical protein
MDENELICLLNSYYNEWPYGHDKEDVHRDWKRGNEMWKRICASAKELTGDYSTIEQYQREKGVFDV